MTAKIERLPGTTYTPKVALHRALERVDDTRAVVIIDVDTDGFIGVDWTAIDSATLSMAAMLLHQKVTGVLTGDTDVETIAESEPPAGS